MIIILSYQIGQKSIILGFTMGMEEADVQISFDLIYISTSLTVNIFHKIQSKQSNEGVRKPKNNS